MARLLVENTIEALTPETLKQLLEMINLQDEAVALGGG